MTNYIPEYSYEEFLESRNDPTKVFSRGSVIVPVSKGRTITKTNYGKFNERANKVVNEVGDLAVRKTEERVRRV